MSKSKHFGGRQAASSLRPWETDDSSAFNSFTVTGTSLVHSPTTQSRTILSKHKPISANARMDDGWRNPTPFRAHVCKLIPGDSFDYIAKNASNVKVRHYGPAGYNPSYATHSIFLGTSGTGHLPRTSTNLVNRTLTEALNKIKDSAVNAAETLATFDKTVKLFYDLARKIKATWHFFNWKNIARRNLWEKARTAYYSAIRSGMPRSAVRRRVFFSSWGLPVNKPSPFWFREKGPLWLELHYAWAPLIADTHAAWGFLKGLPAPRVNAVRHLQETEALPSVSTLSGQLMSLQGEIRSGCKVRIDAELTSHGLAMLDSFSLLNPISLGWELLPYSFVIDWFLPLGNAISALTAPLGLDLKGISSTSYTTSDVRFQWTQFGGYTSGVPITSRVKSISVDRTASFFWPLPQVYIKSPFTSATRAATTIALLNKLK